MALHETVLSIVILLIVLGIFVFVRQIKIEMQQRDELDPDQLSSAISETWRKMGLDQTVGQLENHANEMRQFHGDITQMLRNPRERGEFGEEQLDVLLSDHLPPEMYGIRKQVFDGKTPDAHIKASSGVICIDSKFPLDNYEKYIEADSDDTRAHFKRSFRNDVERQLDKIASDYIKPSAGSADFAFAFIPSESVYYHLITEEYDLLREYTKQGVQVVSPLTLGHKLELIKADVQAQKLSEQTEGIIAQLERLGQRFDDAADEWETLYRHIQNAHTKAEEVDREYNTLRTEFDRIEQPSVTDESNQDPSR